MSNSNKLKKFHFIYKTTNLLNNMSYIGMHSTSNLKDGYIGSGTRLRYSIRKYGITNFKFEILEFLPNRESLKEREKELVNEEFLNNEQCYNLKPGGLGGFNNSQHQFKCSQAAGIKHRERMQNDCEYREMIIKKASQSNKLRHQRGDVKRIQESYSWVGKKHKTETIEKMKNSKKGQGVGTTNSQYGTKWITNGKENKKIKKDMDLPQDWWYGVSK